MTDRELLEMAAKANWNDGPTHISNDGFMDWVRDTKGQWNPLTDDGDALRLAVKLRMAVYVGDGGSVLAESDDYRASEVIDIQTCPYAATRRAIVRAAAEIGKEMP